MYERVYSRRFNSSLRKIARSGRFDYEAVEKAISAIASEKPLDRTYRDHALTGEFKGYRECHIKPDVLLIYKIEKDVLILVLADIGSHANLFGK